MTRLTMKYNTGRNQRIYNKEEKDLILGGFRVIIIIISEQNL